MRPLSEIYQTGIMIVMELENFEKTSKQEVWVKAIEEETKVIEKNETQELVNLPKGKQVIGVK